MRRSNAMASIIAVGIDLSHRLEQDGSPAALPCVLYSVTFACNQPGSRPFQTVTKVDTDCCSYK